jgi:hypothetical protein
MHEQIAATLGLLPFHFETTRNSFVADVYLAAVFDTTAMAFHNQYMVTAAPRHKSRALRHSPVYLPLLSVHVLCLPGCVLALIPACAWSLVCQSRAG